MQQSRWVQSSTSASQPIPKKLLFAAASAATVAIVGAAGMAAAHGMTTTTSAKPTSKADCQNYQAFGFKNRGQCVSWVEHNILGHGYGGG